MMNNIRKINIAIVLSIFIVMLPACKRGKNANNTLEHDTITIIDTFNTLNNNILKDLQNDSLIKIPVKADSFNIDVVMDETWDWGVKESVYRCKKQGLSLDSIKKLTKGLADEDSIVKWWNSFK